MREEYELEVLEHYDIEVKGTRKIRGAFFCDTDEGTMLLKETKISGGALPYCIQCSVLLKIRGMLKSTLPSIQRTVNWS